MQLFSLWYNSLQGKNSLEDWEPNEQEKTHSTIYENRQSGIS